MIYYGRSIDTFESAIVMLNNGVPICEYIDSLSGRAFALKRECSNALYSCALTIEEAVDNLNESIGNVFSIVEPFDLQEPFIMELQYDIGTPTIFRKYYSYGHYIFCYRKGDMIFVHDPDGFPYLSYPYDNFDFGKQKVIVRSNVKLSANIDVDKVRQKGKTFLRATRCSGNSFAYNRIFLQYAVRNYVCQTNKILAFLFSCTPVSKTVANEIESLLSQLLSVTRLAYDEINIIDMRICDLLEELLCS